jgi:hypothetical protein
MVFWVALGVTVNLTLGARSPALAQAVWPQGAAAKVGAVIGLLGSGKPDDRSSSRARAAMREAMLREPLNSSAVANYAALVDFTGDTVASRKLFSLAETLSRRNLLAQSWLIEDAVQRGQVEEAIVHYDRALTVSEELRHRLLPILAAASSDPEIRTPLLPVLARRPLWWADYLTQLATSGDSGATLDDAARAVRLDVRNVSDAALAEAVLRRMITLKAYRPAIGLAEALDGRRSTTRTLVDGDFETPEGVLPFSWWMSDSADIRAFRDTVPTGNGLRIQAGERVLGGAAQQLIGLPPGSYTMSGRIGDHVATTVTGVRIGVECADGPSIATDRLPSAGPQGRQFATRFIVPETHCTAQWINISIDSDIETQPWVDQLRIAKAGGGA